MQLLGWRYRVVTTVMFGFVVVFVFVFVFVVVVVVAFVVGIAIAIVVVAEETIVEETIVEANFRDNDSDQQNTVRTETWWLQVAQYALWPQLVRRHDGFLELYVAPAAMISSRVQASRLVMLRPKYINAHAR